MGAEGRKFVRMRAEGKPGQLRDLLGRALGEFRMRIQPGPDRRATDGKVV